MNVLLKFVVFFLLLTLSSSIKANTTCFVSDSSSSSFELSDESVSVSASNSIDIFILYAMLDLNPIAELFSFFNGLRLRRILDSSNAAIKNAIKQLSIMNNSFVSNKCKSLYSNNFSSWMMTSASYILTLERLQV